MIAGLAGGALLVAGGTWALWSDSTEAQGGAIRAGNLGIDFVGYPVAFDTSDDRSDSDTPIGALLSGALNAAEPLNSASCMDAVDGPDAHTANLNYEGDFPWHAVPGDEVTIAYPFAVYLEGDNMVANLTLKAPSGALSGTDINVHEDILDSTGITVTTWAEGEAYGSPFTIDDTNFDDLFDGTGLTVARVQADSENDGDDDPEDPDDPTSPNIPIVSLVQVPDSGDPVVANVCVLLTVPIPDWEDTDNVRADIVFLRDAAEKRLQFFLEQTRTAGVGLFE
jgi:predicted ribosomally synthesized peptide with SipW-like signal peptide